MQTLMESLSFALECVSTFTSKAHVEVYLPTIVNWAKDVLRKACLTSQTLILLFCSRVGTHLIALREISATPTCEILNQSKPILAALGTSLGNFRPLLGEGSVEEFIEAIQNFSKAEGRPLGQGGGGCVENRGVRV